MNYLYTTSSGNLEIPANVVDTLVEYDCYGVLQPSLAESWEHNEDYTQWTFHIREGVKWVDNDGAEVADVTAHDWVAAAHYILDAAQRLRQRVQLGGGPGGQRRRLLRLHRLPAGAGDRHRRHR